MTKKFTFFFLALLVTIGLWVFYYQNQDHRNLCIKELNLKFINPYLDCDAWEDKTEKMEELQKKLESKISIYKNTNKASRVSVFVRDMDSLRFLGIDENDVFVMASLLKLPLLIAGYKLAEVEPKILEEQITYTGQYGLNSLQTIKPEKEMVVGTRYSIGDLINRSIVYSDNDASKMLFDFYPQKFMDRITHALGIKIDTPDGLSENLVTARAYAGIFRTLYNSSYLTREYSNKALSILTETVYKNGAVAKLPPDVKVAHKFAERIQFDPISGEIQYIQLHECGLVYANDGKEPYTFCILSEGDDAANLEKIQQDLSLEIYNTMVAY